MKSRLIEAGFIISLVTLAVCMVLGMGCEHPNNPPKISRVTAEKEWITPSTECQIECIA